MQFCKIIIACLFLSISSTAFAAGADKSYSEIISLDKSPKDNTNDDLTKKCDQFIKSYPTSDRIPEIRMIAAHHENNPVKALNHYMAIIRQFPKYREILSVYHETCQIFYLSSRYEESAHYAKTALSIDRSKKQTHGFVVILIRSLILSQEYDDASACLKKYASSIDDDERSVLSNELSIRTGERISNAAHSGSRSACELYLLGKQFELERKYDYAFSAYTDLVRLYPRSPESMLASKRLDLLGKQSPTYTKAYLNPRKDIGEFKSEAESTVTETENELAYSVLIGPLYNLAEAKNLKKEMTGSFEQIVLVKSADGFYIYVGRESSAEKAVALKIRLGEEFALNGKIAQRKEDSGREYIYGE